MVQVTASQIANVSKLKQWANISRKKYKNQVDGLYLVRKTAALVNQKLYTKGNFTAL